MTYTNQLSRVQHQILKHLHNGGEQGFTEMSLDLRLVSTLEGLRRSVLKLRDLGYVNTFKTGNTHTVKITEKGARSRGRQSTSS